jgi:DNA-directed RNA polymerase subunit beta'
LYKDLILSNDAIKEKTELGFPMESMGETMTHLYNQQKLLTGLGGEATTYPGVRSPKGIVKTVSGLGSPKSGFYQSRLVRRRQDLSGRSTIIPEPNLSVDEIGVPKKMLQTMYRKPIVRRLVKMGYTPLQAQEEIEKDSPIAKRAMELEVEARPVLVNRAPSLHKFSMMAFKPKITDGKALKIHPLVVKGFGADFDGDTMAVHVPVTDKAVKEAFSMLPTNNLFNPGTGDLMVVPGQEAILGLYRLTEKGKTRRKTYRSFVEAKKAVESGEITATDTVTIGGKRTSVGRYTVNLVLPAYVRDFEATFDKKKIVSILKDVAERSPNQFGEIADGLKDIGNEHSYRVGSTISLADIKPAARERDRLFKKIEPQIKKLDGLISRAGSEAVRADLLQQKVNLYNDKITPAINNLVHKLPSHNNVRRMVDSGARGNYSQVRQMVGAPVLLTDTNGQAIPTPVKRSYAEGLSTSDYWIQSYGARTGAVDRSMQTAVPGYFNKRLVNTLIDTTITEVDCGTRNGRDVPLGAQAMDRYTAGDKFGVVRNTLVTTRVLSTYRKKKQATIRVRSPLSCEAKEGVCAKCFGRREHGQDSSIGDNVGAMSAQAIGEPATQMQMKTFHTGGVASGGIGANLKSGFERILQLTELPSTVKNAATLAEEAGRVTQITPAPAGGNFVFVDSRSHFVPAQVKVSVQEGQTVKKGDALSAGEVNPHDLLRLQGLRVTQDYLSNEISKEYHNQGIKLKPNVIETAVRKLTNLTRINDPGETDFAPGDYASFSKVRALTKGGAKIEHTPELKGINQAPLYGNEDWLSQLNFQNLKRTVVNAATKNWTSSIHGTNPVAAWAYGAEFGRGDKPGTY